MRVKSFVLSAVGSMAFAGVASAAVINFEEFSNGDNLVGTGPHAVGGSTITYEVTVTGPNSGNALIYDSTIGSGEDPDLNQPFDDPSTPGDDMFNPGNILIIGTNNAPDDGDVNDDANGGTLRFEFSETIDFVSVLLFDTGDFGAEVNIEFFDGVGGSLGTALNLGDDLNDNEFGKIDLTGFSGEVAAFQLTGSGAIDEIEFTPRTTISEPGVLGLIGLGLFGIGYVLRRRP